jgi:ATP-binding cassette subfamily C (CFTR/MRP) protein 1
MLPLILSSLSSALVAVNRISRFLTAEELPDPYLIDKSHKAAVIVDGDFTWEKAEVSLVDQGADKGKKKQAKKEKIGKKGKTILPTTAAEKSESPPGEELKDDDNPFELKNLKINIRKGSFVAIVGHVGSGKVIVIIAHNFPELSHLLELCSPILDWGDASDKG